MNDYLNRKRENIKDEGQKLRRNFPFYAYIIIFLFLSLVLFAAFSPGNPPGSGQKKIYYELKSGTSGNGVAAELADAGLLASPDYFRFLLRVTGRSSKIKAGVYSLNDGMSAYEILNILSEGKVRLFALTIPEGWNRKQIAAYLKERKIIDQESEFIRITEDREVLKKYRIPAESTEGYLFPETYWVPDGYSAEKLQEEMIAHFFEQLAEVGVKPDMDPKELHKQVILASLVEREAYHPEERPMMAQVFLNRIKKGMRLESCATIQYLLKKPRERLYEKDLKIPSPYNTYLHAGLPPGPIANPGYKALHAVFHPKPGPYLFFVLKEDRSHHFSETFNEHVAAKKRYLNH